MAHIEAKRDVAISMRLERNDLGLIDRGAELSGLSRTEFMRRAALNEAQTAILNQAVVRLSPDAWRRFRAAIEAPGSKPPAKLVERLKRRPPWREAKAVRPPTA
jgi:uncharacterized protein (DUF1778 family)